MNKKQTAVEWLIETFKITNVNLSHHKLIIEQAKAMEKDQIMDAYEEGYNRVVKLIEEATQRNL